MAIYFADTQRFAGDIGFIAHHGNRQFSRQALDKVWPDLRRVNGAGGGAVDHKQHPIGLGNLLPGAFNADTLHFIIGVAQARGIDDMQRHAVDMDMLAQHVAGGAGDVGDDCCFAARQGVQQARFTGIWPPGDHHLHPFAQQTALTSFGADGVEIGHHLVQLGFNFAIGEEIYFLIREVNRRFHVDAQVSERFHKMIHPRGERPLQRVQRRARRLF